MRAFCCSTLVALALALDVSPALSQDQVIDRVLATVDGRVITLSDVRGARALNLVAPRPGPDPAKAVLDALVDRVLVLGEVERFAPPEPDPAAVEREVAALRAAGPADFGAALAAAGHDDASLRRWVRNSLRIESYIAQRFAGVLDPSEDDVETYRRLHAPEAEAAGRPLDAAAVRAAVAADRRAALVREWIAGLRARASLTFASPLP